MSDQTTKAEAAADQLRAETRIAHEALKDLRALIREGNELVDRITAAAEVAVDERVVPVVTAKLEELGAQTRKAMDESVAKVGTEFERLERILLGEEKRDRKLGRESLRTRIETRGPAAALPDSRRGPRR